MNREYVITIDDYEPQWPLLQVEVYSTIYDPPRYVFRVPLAYVTVEEVGLCSGRFKGYVSDMQEHVVSYEVADSRNEIMTRFAKELSWISEQIQNEWSFDLEMQSVNVGKLRWSFSNPNDALMFKLAN